VVLSLSCSLPCSLSCSRSSALTPSLLSLLALTPPSFVHPRRRHLANTTSPNDVPIPDDAVSFLKRAHAALRPGGVLVVKENVCSSGFVVDDSDRSLTRSHAYMLGLFEKSNVEVSRHARQRDLPKGLFGVRMYACVKKEA
jgi:AdoMet dependent proline di-methyltransferase